MDLKQIAKDKAIIADLDPALVSAIIEQESGWQPWAWNPEPRYRWYWDVKTNTPFRHPTPFELASEYPPDDFPCLAGDPDQEWWAQGSSWGLMQIMGAVARENGCKSPYLTVLCDPETCLMFGLRHLKKLLSTRTIKEALLRWNGGGNIAYPDQVIAHMKNY